MTAKKKQTKPSSEARQERHRFIAGLYRKGIPRSEIYRVVTAKFAVTPQTVRKDVKALGLAVKRYYEEEEILQAEIGAAVDRLKQRAQRNDAAGNRADELLLNLYGMRSLEKYEDGLRRQKQRIEEARAELLEAKASAARLEIEQVAQAADRDNRLVGGMRTTLERIKDQRAASVKDILELTCLFLEQEITKGVNADTRQILSSLRHLTQISLADPSASGAEHQLFALPEGMRWEDPPEPDDGDDLVAE